MRSVVIFAGVLLTAATAWAGGDVVRVHIADAASVRIEGELEVRGRQLKEETRNVRAAAAGDGVLVDGKRDAGPLTLRSADDVVAVDGKRYRGSLQLFARKGKLQVINVVPLEQYLASVLGGEMGAQWPEEALKAQAVVARSYALAKAAASKTRPYDVDATVLSQVYRGVAGEAPTTRKAVEETAGKVLTYRGKVIEAYFHSCCGGRTEDGRALWGGDLSYLSSVKDKYCEFAPDYFWIYRIAPAELGKRVGLGPVTAVRVTDKAPGGRALKVVFESAHGAKTLDGDGVRRAVGYAKLKSTLFRVLAEGGKYVFKGSGSGHGVGMCQWGARAQAEQGRSYRDILKYYFPEADLDRL